MNDRLIYLNSNDGTGWLAFGEGDALQLTSKASVDEIQAFIDTHKKSYIFCCLSYDLKEELNNIERNVDSTKQNDLLTTKPIAFIERYCSKLNINKELTMLAKFICNKVESQNIINDNAPHSIAAGVIYFISQNCNLNISKLEVKSICGVSEVTINKCFKKLDSISNQLIPAVIFNKYN